MPFENDINPQHIEYFRRRLLTWRSQLVSDSGKKACPADNNASLALRRKTANATNGNAISCPQDREQKLIHKINETLRQVEAATLERYF